MKLILLVELEEDLLTGASPYADLPDQLDKAILEATPRGAAQVDSLFLLNPRKNPLRALNNLALNYHHYAVNVRGEKCTDPDCELHPNQNVLNFHDYSRRSENPPGFN